jgi:DNA-directed RNA polymerase specialized sigma24 family protein
MVRLRMDRRLQGRLDPSDVLQEAYLDFARRLGDYCRQRPAPFYLWLRSLTGQKLIDLHRRHLGTQMRAMPGRKFRSIAAPCRRPLRSRLLRSSSAG